MEVMLQEESATINKVIEWMTEFNPIQRHTATDVLEYIDTVTSNGKDFSFNGSELESIKSVLDKEIH